MCLSQTSKQQFLVTQSGVRQKLTSAISQVELAHSIGSLMYMCHANRCSMHCSQLIIVHQLHVVALHISCRFKAGDRTQVEGAVHVLQLPQVPQVAQLPPQEVRHVLPPLLRQCPIIIPVGLQVAGDTPYFRSHGMSCKVMQNTAMQFSCKPLVLLL